MKVDWPAILFVGALLSLGLFASDADAGENYWVGKGTWHPTFELNEVTVMINWMADGVLVPCGKNRPLAVACAFPPSSDDIPKKGKVCEITHPGFRSSPTDDELDTFGRLFETCLTKMNTRIITLRFKRNGSEISVRPTETFAMAMPCGISISLNLAAETKGHEGIHCWRGSWHDKI